MYKTSEEKIIRMLLILRELKKEIETNENFTMRNFCKENRIANNISTVLIHGGIIKANRIRTDNGFGKSKYKWISINPTREMAIKTIKEMRKMQKKYEENAKNKNQIKNTQKQETMENQTTINYPISKTYNRKKGTKEETIKKYFNALKKLSILLEYNSNINFKLFSRKNNITNGIKRHLLRLNYIQEIKDGYKMILLNPTIEDAKRLINEINNHITKNLDIETKEKNNETKEKQLKYYETSLLFGLIKIKTYPIYK